MAGYSVTFSAKLIEKIAGIEQPSSTQQAHPPGPQGPLLPRIHPEVLALRSQDAQLGHALASSRRVGHALLKAEEEELPKVKQLAAELLAKYSFTARPVPCQQERDDCLECYTRNPQDPLRCASLVDAYAACADKAFAQQTRQAQAAR